MSDMRASDPIPGHRPAEAIAAPGDGPLPRTSPFAIASLLSGILGWTLLPVLGSVIAVATGHVARSQIRQRPAELGGGGLAFGGLLLGYLMLALVVGCIAFFLLFVAGTAVLGWHGGWFA